MSQNYFSNYKNNQTVYVWVAILLALCSFVFIYRTSINTLFYNWNEYGTYSHGYLTILLSAFLIYTCVKQARISYSGPSTVSAICILIISLIWLFAYLANINTIQMLCMPFFIYFILTYFSGLKNYRILLVPIFILLFTIPIWSLILPILQDTAVHATNKLLSISNLDYRVVDNTVIFSKGVFEIEESCSGLRYLLVGVLLSIIYGFLNYQSSWSMLVLILIAVTIMLIGNLIRIMVVIGLGVGKGMDYPLVKDHENLGWVLFAFLLVPLFIIARYLKPNLWQKIAQDEINITSSDNSMRLNKLFFVFVIYLIVISAAPLYASYLMNDITKVASLKPNGVIADGRWTGPVLLSSRWAPNYSLYSEHFVGHYRKQGQTVVLNSFLYTNQGLNGELINVNNQLVDKNKWGITDVSSHQAVSDKANLNSISVNKVTIHSKQAKDCFRIWYWFDVNGAAYTKNGK